MVSWMLRTAKGSIGLILFHAPSSLLGNNGHCSATYFSAASRNTQAVETFLCLAKALRVW